MSFVLGVNYPWIRCGHDFGPRPPAWAGVGRTDWGAFTEELSRLADLGLTTVRFWVLGGGVNVPVGARIESVAERVPLVEPWPAWRRPFLALRRARAERWAWRAPFVLPRAFLEDFEAFLGAARAARVRLVPSLVSFELFFPIRDRPSGVPTGGRAELALAPGFLDAALEPLLDVAAAHRDVIAAFEVANEPAWAVRPGGREKRFGPHPPWVAPERMGRFLADAARRIARRDLVATIGFAEASVPWLPPAAMLTLTRLAEAGRYVHQLHHYPKADAQGLLPPASASPIRPIWVGELGTTTARRWRDAGASEDDPNRFVARRLELVRARGYDGALLWSCTATDEQTAWTPSVRAQAAQVASSFGLL